MLYGVYVLVTIVVGRLGEGLGEAGCTKEVLHNKDIGVLALSRLEEVIDALT
jgi:hypothetical protein